MKALVSWSGGKDSALALHRAKQEPALELSGLVTTLSAEFDRVSMHGVRRALLEAQARALGLPLFPIFLPTPPIAAQCGMNNSAAGFTAFAASDSYETAMLAAFANAKAAGIEVVVFGDIYLADLRAYRDKLLAAAGLRGLYPLWGSDPRALLAEFRAGGFQAVTVCVDGDRLGAQWVGRELDENFTADLPADIDPCGENGEYHSFVHASPDFAMPVGFSKGEIVRRASFWFCDLLPGTLNATAQLFSHEANHRRDR